MKDGGRTLRGVAGELPKRRIEAAVDRVIVDYLVAKIEQWAEAHPEEWARFEEHYRKTSGTPAKPATCFHSPFSATTLTE